MSDQPQPEPLIPFTENPIDPYRGQEWWITDHYDSDRNNHIYCGPCHTQIPDFLIRYENRMTAPYVSAGEPATCEGCGKVAAQ